MDLYLFLLFYRGCFLVEHKPGKNTEPPINGVYFGIDIDFFPDKNSFFERPSPTFSRQGNGELLSQGLYFNYHQVFFLYFLGHADLLVLEIKEKDALANGLGNILKSFNKHCPFGFHRSGNGQPFAFQ
jgi:hypothetical protein